MFWYKNNSTLLKNFVFHFLHLQPSGGYVLQVAYVKPQSHIHDFGPGRATVHPDLASQ